MWARLMLDPKEPTVEKETRRKQDRVRLSIRSQEKNLQNEIREEPDPLKRQGQRDWLHSLHTRE